MNIVIFDIDWQCSVSNWAREASLWYAELSKDSMRVWLWALDCLGVSGLWSKCHPRGGGREEPGHCRQARTGRGLAPTLWSLHWHQVIQGLNPFRESLDFLCWRDATIHLWFYQHTQKVTEVSTCWLQTGERQVACAVGDALPCYWKT